MTPAQGREALDQAIVRGSDLLKQGKLDQAQGAFRSALELEPGNPRVLALLGLSYFRGNQFSEAQPIYETLVEKAPTDASHRLNLGLVYLKLSDAERAIDALEASRALDPSQGRAVSYLGLAYARAGRYAEAYRSFLLAGQNELATEIEVNLTPAERDGIHSQLGRTPSGPLPAVARTVTPPPPPQPAAKQAPPAQQWEAEPRTKPPSAPPKSKPKAEDPEARVVPGHESSAAATGLGTGMLSSPEITIQATESAQFPRVTASDEVSITSARPERVSDSMQFVLPKADPVAAPLDGQSMVSMAVAAAAPTGARSGAALRTATGGIAPRPLSELATEDLVRPDDGSDPFEITPGGALIIRVSERVFTRLDGVHVTGGALAYEPTMRRSRGHQIEERFDHGGSALHAVTGKGYLIATLATAGTEAAQRRGMFLAVELDDDILYLREDLVFAFESTLRWENGNVPGLRGRLHVVQFRGDGALALRLARPLVRVKLPPQGLVFVDADRLAGWVGRVIPRAVVPPVGGPLGTTCVECTGEGVVLVEPALASAAPPQPEVEPVASEAPAVVEPVQPEIDPEVAAFAAGFDDDKI